MKTILVTGASGFIGQALSRELLQNGQSVILATRSSQNIPSLYKDARVIKVDLNDNETNWIAHLQSVDTVIHLAARVHVMKEQAEDSLSLYRQINIEGTEKIAKSAVLAGVRRFIYLSSVKVHGEENILPYSELDKKAPLDEYGLSKSDAENKLLEIARQSKMEVVIIRPPLVYGPGVKANFYSLFKIVNKNFPLPFGNIDNKRSYVALTNLVNFIIFCIDHPKAANEVFLISDGEDISTTELVEKIAKALDKKKCLISIPVGLMRFLAMILGKRNLTRRLFGSLRVDSSKARELLGWKPVITMDEQLKITADTFLNEKTI